MRQPLILQRILARRDAAPSGEGWRSPIVMLMLMVVAMELSHATWFTLLNNFAVNEVDFTGREIGILQSVREIPGFLSFAAVLLLVFIREQRLALVSLLLLAVGTASTGYLPYEYAFYATTLLMSLGFHYYETMAQSLSLQWLPKERAAHGLGKIVAAASFAAIAAYCLVGGLKYAGVDFRHIYLIAGGLTLAITCWLFLAFPVFPEKVAQRKTLVLKSRYWLYYALVFMSGARRQIFLVFAGFMMVEKFGYSVEAIALLFIVNHAFNMVLAPQIGKLIIRFGERKALMLEYIGLIGVFATYAFVTDPTVAAVLYVVDHAFFAIAIAIKTYFQKIASPEDIAPTAGVAFTINHIAAVFLPVMLGFVWLQSPSAVFLLGAAMAATSLLLSVMIPRAPVEGHETIFARRGMQPAE
ncbi:MAG: MFS transporter [Pseudomonadota bacterium]